MKILKRAFSWVKAKVGLGFGYIQNHDFIAVELTNHLKSMVRSKVVQGAVRLTPTKLDDKGLDWLDKVALPVIAEIAAIHGIIRESEKNSVAVEQIIDRLSLLSPGQEGKVYADYAGRLNYRLADGVLSDQEAWEQAQDTFYTFFKGK